MIGCRSRTKRNTSLGLFNTLGSTVLLLAALAFGMAGCSQTQDTSESAAQALKLDPSLRGIKDVISIQERSIQEQDGALYLSTIDSGNTTYFNESKYFAHMLAFADFSDFEMKVADIRLESDNSAVAEIHQSYKLNNQINATIYRERFHKVGDQWLDHDVAFEQTEAGGIKVYYMPEVGSPKGFIDLIERSLIRLEETFPDPLTGNVEIKLYSDRELLRQKTDLGIAWLFTGWAEEGHAIKAFTGRESDYNYETLFTHELIHKLTISVSKGNMPIWFAEGLAVHYGTFRVNGATYMEEGKVQMKDIKITLQDLSEVPLNQLTDQNDILTYYAAAGMYVRYLAEIYGDDQVFALYQTLGSYPRSDIASDPAWARVADERMRAVLDEVLSLDYTQISEGYLKWLDNYN